MNIDDYNKSLCYTSLLRENPLKKNSPEKTHKSREQLQLALLKKAGLIKTPECMICCTDIPVEKIYVSEKCKCNYIYCNTCWNNLKEVRHGVKQCPQCRVETTAPIHSIAL